MALGANDGPGKKTGSDSDALFDKTFGDGAENITPDELRKSEEDLGSSSNDQVDSQKGLDDTENEFDYPGNSASRLRDFAHYTKLGDRPINKSKLQKAVAAAKGGKGVLGLITIFGVTGGIFASFFAPASLLISLTENLITTNDSSGTSISARMDMVLARLTNTTDDGGLCSSTVRSIKCKNSRISNKALRKLDKMGVKALNVDITKGRYPANNPKLYQIDLGNGKTANVKTENLRGFLNANPKIQRKVLGTGGAFNARFMAWSGNIVKRAFYNRFALSKSGGNAEKTTQRFGSAREKIVAAQEKFKRKIPGLDKLNNFSEYMNQKVSNKLTRAKVGGVAYQTAFAGCLISKAPSLIAAGVAGVQIVRLLPLINEYVLSPGHAQKASGLVKDSVTSESVDLAATPITSTSKNAQGKMTSASDSAALQAAMGINTNKLSVSKLGDFIPGYSVLVSPEWKAARETQKALGPACNVVLNPVSMYIFLATESLITRTNPLGLFAGLIGSAVVGAAAGPLVNWALEEGGKAIIAKLAENDALENLEGERLGDALGASAMAFYASGSMSRFVPALTEAGLASYGQVRQNVIAKEREMDLAALSPFDTSSRHTFMGNISHTLGTHMLANGGSKNIASIIGGMLSLPRLALVSNVSAATYNTTYCSYAESFDLVVSKEDDPTAETPAINAVGLPCTGLTYEQSQIESEEAEQYLVKAGWLDEAKLNENRDESEEPLTVQELVREGIVKAETPLEDFILSCGDTSTGDYLYEVYGCTVKDSFKSGKSYVDNPENKEVCIEDNNGNKECESNFNKKGTSKDDTKAHLSMAVWLLDYQIGLSINGDDEETYENTPGPVDNNPLPPGSGECPNPGSVVSKSITKGYINGKEISTVFCEIENTRDTSMSGIRDSQVFMDNNDILKTNVSGKIAVSHQAAPDLVNLVNEYKKRTGKATFDATFSYRSHNQQCIMYFYTHRLKNLPSSTCTIPLDRANAMRARMTGNYRMPGSFYSSKHESGNAMDVIDLTWINRCASSNYDGKSNGKCFNYISAAIPGDLKHVVWRP